MQELPPEDTVGQAMDPRPPSHSGLNQFDHSALHNPSLLPSTTLCKALGLGAPCSGIGFFRAVPCNLDYLFSFGNFITQGHPVAVSCISFSLSSSEASSQRTGLLGTLSRTCMEMQDLACLGPRDISQMQPALEFGSTRSGDLGFGLFERLSSVWVQTTPVPYVKKCPIILFPVRRVECKIHCF